MKRQSLADLAAAVDDGDVVAFGGKTLHRAPMAFVRELARREVGNLTLLGLANSMDVDLLCGTGQASAAHYGYVGFEAFGLAPNYRRRVEAGAFDAHEGTCYTVATMLRGAKQGVPSLPIAGLDGSDLLEVNDYLTETTCPFTGDRTAAVRTVTPDVGVVHATEADENGNVHYDGADLTESLVAAAADRVFVTAERVVDAGEFEADAAAADVPGFLVDGVAEVPYGAHPCSSPGTYGYDAAHLREYLDRSKAGTFEAYLETYLGADEADYRDRAVDGRADALAWTPEVA
ncbi:MAG: CoA transferase subunit A [Haloferacaceae archaeon]